MNVNRADCERDGAPRGSRERGGAPPTPHRRFTLGTAARSGESWGVRARYARARDRTLDSRATACRFALRLRGRAWDDPGEPRCRTIPRHVH